MKTYDLEAVEYIAKLADGGLRDSLSLLDKCLLYNPELTIENVVQALGTVEYEDMIQLTDYVLVMNTSEIITVIENLHAQGKELKQFIKSYLQFLLDIQKYAVGCDWKYMNLPKLDKYVSWLEGLHDEDFDICFRLLDLMIRVNAEVKYSSSVKYDLEAYLVQFIGREEK